MNEIDMLAWHESMRAFRFSMQALHFLKRNGSLGNSCTVNMAANVMIVVTTIMNEIMNRENDSSSSEDSFRSDESDVSDINDISSDEDEEMLLYAMIMLKKRGNRIPTEKIMDYVERVVPGYSREQFKQHFR